MPDHNDNPSEKTDQPEFTASLKALDEVLNRFKSGTLTLEESLSLFEDGVKNLKICQTQLAEAKGKVEELVKGLQEDGELMTQPFDA
jgi:exodeoxyribonuclease VII small subunit